MKKTIVALILIVILISCNISVFAKSITKLPRPVGAWDMTEGDGTVVYDVSGNGNNGMLGNDKTGWIKDFEGKFDNVIAPGYVTIANKQLYDASEDFTFATWFYVSENQTGFGIIAYNNSEKRNSAWDIHINMVGNLCVEAQGPWGMNGLIIVDQDFRKNPKWRHFAVTFKKSTLTFEIYIDGKKLTTGVKRLGKEVSTITVKKAIEPPTEKDTLNLFAQYANINPLIGRLSMVRFYDERLNAEQITALMNGDGLKYSKWNNTVAKMEKLGTFTIVMSSIAIFLLLIIIIFSVVVFITLVKTRKTKSKMEALYEK